MRYVKFLILAAFLFLSMIFFFQNQAPLSQQMTMTLNLFFLPAMTSIPLPFYFLLIASFFIGAVLCWFMLIWDRINITGKYIKAHRQVGRLQSQVNTLSQAVEQNRAQIATFQALKESAKEGAMEGAKAEAAKIAANRADGVFPQKLEDSEVVPHEHDKPEKA